MVATLIVADSGSAQVAGHDVVRDRYEVRRRIGVLSDARGIYPRLTARENIRYYGALHGLFGPALEARVDALIDALGISDLADRRTQGFSQGERMKVAIARALVHDPDTILLDEPTNGLDIMSTRALREMLRKLRDAGQVPAVLVARDAGSDGAVRPDRDPQPRPRRRLRHGARAARADRRNLDGGRLRPPAGNRRGRGSMSATGRPEREYRRAQHEGSPVSATVRAPSLPTRSTGR